MARVGGGFKQRLSERFSSTWKLLSETTSFLAKTSAFSSYENQLRDLRKRLQLSHGDDRITNDLRREIIALRSALRIQGYDLSLGSLELSVEGFRSDAAIAEGYRRAVLFIGEKGLRALAGEANHAELHDRLETASRRGEPIAPRHKHYLWFRWKAGTLSISGSATETAEDFERLRAWCEVPENRLGLLGIMKTLK